MTNRMERPATIALADRDDRVGWVLDGLYRPGLGTETGGAVIAPPHPLYGGSMDSPVVNEIAFACERVGIAALRFNWRGIGASSGQASGAPEDALEDYCAALDFLEESVSPPLVAAGYSFGGATAVAAAARTTVRRLVLVSPPPAMLDRSRLEHFHGKVFVAVGDSDPMAPASELEAIARGLDRVQFEVLDQTDHFFVTGPGLKDLREKLTGWLEL
jgi:alpha/beta superfamily hydrolase